MRRSSRELMGEFDNVNPMPALELALAEPVLLGMMQVTQADYPPIRRLESHGTISATSHMRAFNG